MIFNSLPYLIFLAAVAALYWRLRTPRAQNVLLLLASYFFYATWDWRFLLLLGFATGLNYGVGRGLAALSDGRRRRALLLAGLGINFGLLGVFKYAGFFVESFTALLNGLGMAVSAPVVEIALPVGISFFTFQAVGYLLDVYARRLQASDSLLRFGVFLAFFPLLLAGPIERGKRLLPQLAAARRADPDAIEQGLVLLLIGLVRKVVIADTAASLIDPALFADPGAFPPGQVVLSVYLFALQIYGDFAGYSDMARGAARLLGIDLMENFNQPYFAQTVAEFWRRWHIALSSWLRDYLFFPLSRALRGRRVPALPTVIIATMTTMLLAGLWHGAAWTFVLWGGVLGVYLVMGRLLQNRLLRLRKHPRRAVRWATAVLSAGGVFHLILVTWVLFRAPTLDAALAVYGQIGAALSGAGLDLLALGWLPLGLYALSFAIDAGQAAGRDHAFTRRFPLAVGGALYAAAVLLIIIFSVQAYVPFFYFRF